MSQILIKERFWVRHGAKIIVMLLFTVAMMSVALLPGIGYNATVKVEQRGIIAGAHLTGSGYAVNRLVNGTIDAYFSPLIYPISYLAGRDYVFRRFSGASEFWDHEGSLVKEAALLGTLSVEFFKNVPYFLLFGMASTLSLWRLAKVPAVARFLAKPRGSLLKGFVRKRLEGFGLTEEEIESRLIEWVEGDYKKFFKERPEGAHGERVGWRVIQRRVGVLLIAMAYVVGFVGLVYFDTGLAIFPLVALMIILGIALL